MQTKYVYKFPQFPVEVLEKVFTETDGATFLALRRCCHKFLALVDSIERREGNELWHRLALLTLPIMYLQLEKMCLIFYEASG